MKPTAPCCNRKFGTIASLLAAPHAALAESVIDFDELFHDCQRAVTALHRINDAHAQSIADFFTLALQRADFPGAGPSYREDRIKEIALALSGVRAIFSLPI